MDIVLKTNSDDPALTFGSIQMYADGSGGRCLLIVRSGWIAASFIFYFGERDLAQFVVELEHLNETLEGSAVLAPTLEQDRLAFSATGLGGVMVSGVLVEHGPPAQRVSFEFAADQTCLGPLIADFKSFLRTA